MRILMILLITSVLLSCLNKTQEAASEETAETEVNAVVDEWLVIFDGTSLDGWRGYNQDSLPANWVIEENALKSLGKGADIGGDIVYGSKEFDNFELKLEWKISEGGNSGIFYHVVEGPKYDAAYQNAPEYQVLDDIGFPDPLEEWQKLGADYAMYPADSATKIVKPANEWNTTRIIFTPDNVQYWLNGQKIVEFVPWSEDWYDRKLKGKWANFPDYGVAKSGLIGLQDHGSPIWYRNIKIKSL